MLTVRSRGVLGVVLTFASLVVLLLAGLASATNFTNETSVELDSDVHWWQQNQADQNKVISFNGYEYTIYWDAADGSGNVYAKITRRTLSSGVLETITFNTTEGRLIAPLDAHNNTVLGVSSHDGRLHVQWTMHNERIHYAISNEGCLSAARLSSCTFTWRGQTSNTTQEGKLSYPEFFSSPEGTLYSGFRSGSGSSGDWVMHVYNDNGTWTDLGIILLGTTGTYDLDGLNELEEGWLPARRRGPYVDAAKFDTNGRLHLMWTWRESVPNATEAVLSPLVAQHDIYYAYSDDGGLTWNDNSGTRVATHESDPIRVEDAETVAVHVRPGYWRPNVMRMEIDRDNQPHIVMPTSETFSLERTLIRVREKHFWRTTDGVWHEQFMEPAEAYSRSFNTGSIQFDRANDMYYVYGKNKVGWYPWEEANADYSSTLQADHFVLDGRENLVVEPISRDTTFYTTDYIGIPIGGGETENRDIEIRVKNTTNETSGHIYFITDEHQTWDTRQAGAFTVRNEGAFNTYRISMNGVPNWRGTLRSLEFAPNRVSTPGSGKITIDYIRVKNGNGTVAKEWEFNEGSQLWVAESAGSDNWSTWEHTQIARGVNHSWVDMGSYDIDENRYEKEHKITFQALIQGELGNERLRLYEYDIAGDRVAKQWGFGSDTIGWTAPRNVTGFGWASDSERGTIAGTVSGADSQLVSPTMRNFETARTSKIIIRMKNSRATALRASLCWTVDGGTTFRSEQCTRFALTADDAYHIYEISTAGWTNWERHELTKFRVDPSDNEEVSTGTFGIDYVRIED